MRSARTIRRGSRDSSDFNEPPHSSATSARRAATIAATLASAPLALSAVAIADEVDELNLQALFCSATAHALFRACGNHVEDDYWVAFGICINEADDTDRAECFADAKRARGEEGSSAANN
jgi:hypothetical protein